MFQNVKRGNIEIFSKPECQIKINGVNVTNWISFNINLTMTGDLDAFTVTLPWDVSDNPKDKLLFSGSKEASIVVKGSVDIGIWISLKGKSKLLISGKMDSANWTFDEEGEIVIIKGRSYGAAPFDYKDTTKYQNMTATDIHAKLAGIHGLNPVAPKKTSDFIGEYTGIDHVSLMREMSHWDLIQMLARQEGFISAVRDKDWYFGPLDNYYTGEDLAFTWGHNIMELSFDRAPNAARNLTVEITSWHEKSQIVERASLNSSGHDYIIKEFVPNITRDQAQKLANNKLKFFGWQQLEGKLTTMYMPDIDINKRIALYGVGKGLSQIYYITRLNITGSKSRCQCTIDFSNLQMLGENGS